MHKEPDERDKHRSAVLTSTPHNRRDSTATTTQNAYPSTNGASGVRKESQKAITQSVGAASDAVMTSIATHSTTTADPILEPFWIFCAPPRRANMAESSTNASANLSDDDILQYLVKEIEENVKVGGEEGSRHYMNASMQPHITSSSLEELDMTRIINNPKLRHDVNFDRDLHFRPNLDGSKGKQKILQADQYWNAVLVEFSLYSHLQRSLYTLRTQRSTQAYDENDLNRLMRLALRRLPNIFVAVRDILKTLVPDHDQAAVAERLNVEHLIQQVQHGVCDLENLSEWLAMVLKNHCAPMRDGMVDAMEKMITTGAREQCNEELVRGLRALMNILEAMKLDVANHQIRHMRPLLIEDTVNFQRRYHAHRIAIGKIDGTRARAWIHDEMSEVPGSMPLEALVSGTIRDLLCATSSSSTPPPSFYLDVDRLRVLRVELQSSVYLELCRQVLKEILGADVPEQTLLNGYSLLQDTLPAIVGSSGKFYERRENVAVHLAHVVTQVDQRATKFDVNLVQLTEQMLASCLRPDSHEYTITAGRVFDRLVPKVQARVRQHIKYTALSLQDTLVPSSAGLPSSATRAAATQPHHSNFGAVCAPAPATTRSEPVDPDEDLIRRLAHILVLHWQVWADLVYLPRASSANSSGDRDSSSGSEESETEECDSLSTIVPSAAASPTMMPVAEAVFAPGHKFLPRDVVTSTGSGGSSNGHHASGSSSSGKVRASSLPPSLLCPTRSSTFASVTSTTTTSSFGTASSVGSAASTSTAASTPTFGQSTTSLMLDRRCADAADEDDEMDSSPPASPAAPDCPDLEMETSALVQSAESDPNGEASEQQQQQQQQQPAANSGDLSIDPSRRQLG